MRLPNSQKVASSHIVNPLRSSIIIVCLLSLLGTAVQAQSKAIQAEALALAREGRVLIQEGDFEKAVIKFSQANKLVPKSLDYQLGLANAWFFAGEYSPSMEIVRPLMMGKNSRAEAFQIYGNCQDAKGQAYEALETYRQGLLRFPNSGLLYQEMGLVEAGRERFVEALGYWEKGIAVEPMLPSNYFLAAQRLFEMGDYAWAANYAEVHIVLARNGEQVRTMSELLMACYEKARCYDYDRAYVWRFFQPTSMGNGLPDSASTYHRLLDEAFTSQFTDTSSQVGIPTLIEMRRFVCHYLPSKIPKHSTAPLFAWHQRLIKAGHFESFNYWLLIDARNDEFMQWLELEQPAFDAFEDWMLQESLYLTPKWPILRTKTEEKHRQ